MADGAVVLSAVLIIVLALIAALLGRRMQFRTTFTRQLAEHAVTVGRSEQQYRLMFDGNPNPMWVEDSSTGAFIAVNDAAVASYGYSRAEFLQMRRADIELPVDTDIAVAPTPDAHASQRPQHRHRRRSGGIIDVTVTSQSIEFDGAHACLTLALDVTDRLRAEEALRQGEQRMRLIIDTALDAVVTMDERGAITDWNAQAERIFGWSAKEAIGRHLADTIIPAAYRDAHRNGLAKFLESGVGPILNRRFEIVALTRGGLEIPVELTISPARFDGEWTFSAFIRDRSEQQKTAEAVRLGEQRYRELFEDVPVGLYRSTPEGKLIDANPAMLAILGYPDLPTLLATPAAELYADPADRARWIQDMARTGRVLDFDVRIRRWDGSHIWARDTTNAARASDGSILLYEGVLEDITDRVEAENRLQANERRLNQILEAVPVGILVTDPEGRDIFTNAAATAILAGDANQRSHSVDIASGYKAYLAGSELPYPAERLPLMRALKGEKSAVEDMEIRHDGKAISLHVHGAPIVDRDGRIVAAVSAFFDTTQKRSLEEQLRQAQKMEAVGQLAGGVAHDFNNLLTVIISYTAMLLERTPAGGADREDLEEITGAAERAARLTRQLLAFSRKQVVQPQVININAVITNLETMLRRLIGEDVELETRLDSAVTRVSADPGQLEQLLMNLVVNARDAMPTGGRLSITTSRHAASDGSAPRGLLVEECDYVVLGVTDTGTGMEPDVQQRIFDPFFTTKEQGRGTGLGLSTVYGIVKQAGGEISVHSEPGRGTTFRIFLPQVAPTREQKIAQAGMEQIPTGTETVLLVEDDDNLRALAVRVLRKFGYKVLVASGGLEALKIAADPTTTIHAVVTDVVMPDMNGREVVERILEGRPGLPYMLMSGYTDDEVLRRGVLRGETPFLQKPFTPPELAKKVREIIDSAEELGRQDSNLQLPD